MPDNKKPTDGYRGHIEKIESSDKEDVIKISVQNDQDYFAKTRTYKIYDFFLKDTLASLLKKELVFIEKTKKHLQSILLCDPDSCSGKTIYEYDHEYLQAYKSAEIDEAVSQAHLHCIKLDKNHVKSPIVQNMIRDTLNQIPDHILTYLDMQTYPAISAFTSEEHANVMFAYNVYLCAIGRANPRDCYASYQDTVLDADRLIGEDIFKVHVGDLIKKTQNGTTLIAGSLGDTFNKIDPKIRYMLFEDRRVNTYSHPTALYVRVVNHVQELFQFLAQKDISPMRERVSLIDSMIQRHYPVIHTLLSYDLESGKGPALAMLGTYPLHEKKIFDEKKGVHRILQSVLTSTLERLYARSKNIHPESMYQLLQDELHDEVSYKISSTYEIYWFAACVKTLLDMYEVLAQDAHEAKQKNGKQRGENKE